MTSQLLCIGLHLDRGPPCPVQVPAPCSTTPASLTQGKPMIAASQTTA